MPHRLSQSVCTCVHTLLLLLQGKGLGEFHDIDQLTMFADYRVPAVLREFGVLQYSQKLAAQVPPGVSNAHALLHQALHMTSHRIALHAMSAC